MTETITRTPVEELGGDALNVTPVDRDWTEGYTESWEYVEAPDCPECGDYARWDADSHEWRCPDHGEVEDAYAGAEGPMMSYAYPLPDLGAASDEIDAADRLFDLPLCVVVRQDTDTFELALTGGGMDLSWEICEAFTRLGFLPPLHFCDLPGMAGRGHTGGDGRPRDKAPERDEYVIAACRRSAEVAAMRAERIAQRLREI